TCVNGTCRCAYDIWYQHTQLCVIGPCVLVHMKCAELFLSELMSPRVEECARFSRTDVGQLEGLARKSTFDLSMAMRISGPWQQSSVGAAGSPLPSAALTSPRYSSSITQAPAFSDSH